MVGVVELGVRRLDVVPVIAGNPGSGVRGDDPGQRFTRRIRALLLSLMYRLPAASKAIPTGLFNRAEVAGMLSPL